MFTNEHVTADAARSSCDSVIECKVILHYLCSERASYISNKCCMCDANCISENAAQRLS